MLIEHFFKPQVKLVNYHIPIYFIPKCSHFIVLNENCSFPIYQVASFQTSLTLYIVLTVHVLVLLSLTAFHCQL